MPSYYIVGKVIEGVKGVGLYSKRIKSDARKVIWAVRIWRHGKMQ